MFKYKPAVSQTLHVNFCKWYRNIARMRRNLKAAVGLIDAMNPFRHQKSLMHSKKDLKSNSGLLFSATLLPPLHYGKLYLQVNKISLQPLDSCLPPCIIKWFWTNASRFYLTGVYNDSNATPRNFVPSKKFCRLDLLKYVNRKTDLLPVRPFLQICLL